MSFVAKFEIVRTELEKEHCKLLYNTAVLILAQLMAPYRYSTCSPEDASAFHFGKVILIYPLEGILSLAVNLTTRFVV